MHWGFLFISISIKYLSHDLKLLTASDAAINV